VYSGTKNYYVHLSSPLSYLQQTNTYEEIKRKDISPIAGNKF